MNKPEQNEEEHKITEDNYKKDTYYIDSVRQTVMKIVSWSKPHTIGRFNFDSHPIVVMLGSSRERGWTSKYLREATDSDIAKEIELQNNHHVFGDSSIQLLECGSCIIGSGIDDIYIDKDEIKGIMEILNKGYKPLGDKEILL